MANITRTTLQRLATVYAVSKWKEGAFGPLRVQKSLFFADQESGQPYIFGFKKWNLGQYSDEVSATLTDLTKANIITVSFDGPADVLRANVPKTVLRELEKTLRASLPDWSKALDKSIKKWGYLKNDSIIQKAHDDPSYTTRQCGQVIFRCTLPDFYAMKVDEDLAEDLGLLVDPIFQQRLRSRMTTAINRYSARSSA